MTKVMLWMLQSWLSQISFSFQTAKIEQALNFSVFVSVVFGGFGFPENVKQNSLLLSPRPVGWLGMLPRGIVGVSFPSSHIVLLEVRSFPFKWSYSCKSDSWFSTHSFGCVKTFFPLKNCYLKSTLFLFNKTPVFSLIKPFLMPIRSFLSGPFSLSKACLFKMHYFFLVKLPVLHQSWL